MSAAACLAKEIGARTAGGILQAYILQEVKGHRCTSEWGFDGDSQLSQQESRHQARCRICFVCLPRWQKWQSCVRSLTPQSQNNRMCALGCIRMDDPPFMCGAHTGHHPTSEPMPTFDSLPITPTSFPSRHFTVVFTPPSSRMPLSRSQVDKETTETELEQKEVQQNRWLPLTNMQWHLSNTTDKPS